MLMNDSAFQKIVIFGGSGFIGINLLLELSSNNNIELINYDLNSHNFLGNNSSLNNSIKHIEADFKKVKDFSNIINKADCVIHLIHTTIPENSIKNKIDEISSNLIPSIQLFEAAVELNVKKIIFVSTGGKIYGNRSKYSPIKEDEEPEPLYPYEITKLEIEKYLKLITQNTGTSYIILRPSNPYGENYFYIDRPLGLINVALQKLKNNSEITIWGNGSNVRDFIYIKDLINAIKKSIFIEACDNYILNAGTGKGYSVLEILSLIEEITGKKLAIKFESSRKIDVNYNVLDITAIKSVLNWEPEVDIREGIKITWKWIND